MQNLLGELRSDQLDKLQLVLSDTPSLVGMGGERVPLPESVTHLLQLSLRELQNKAPSPSVSTQVAADYLSVSRPFLIQLLESGEIPFYRVGTHRRIRRADLITYRDAREANRQVGLSRVFDAIQEAGHYEDAP